MKNDFNKATDKQRLNIEGAIKGVAQQIAELAPHPDRPGYKGPVLVASHPAASGGDDRQAMLGSLFFECMLGIPMGSVMDTQGPADMLSGIDTPSWMQGVSWNDMVEVIDEYWTDRRQSASGYTLGAKGSVNGAFNFHSSGMQAYIADMPDREKLEGTYARLARALERLDLERQDPEPKLPEAWEIAARPAVNAAPRL